MTLNATVAQSEDTIKPYIHARISAKKFGGEPSDYQALHDWFDSTKAAVADMRHRMILHNAFGIFLAEQVFGTMEWKKGVWIRQPYITNSAGQVIQVRDVGEQHVLDDLGCIPSLDKCLAGMKLEAWMGGPIRHRKVIRLDQLNFATQPKTLGELVEELRPEDHIID